MHYLLLVLSTFIFSLYVLTTYSSWKDSHLYCVLAIATSASSQILWVLAARLIKETNQLFFFSMVWDLAITATWLFLPLALGVTIKPTGWVGLSFILVGVVILNHALRQVS